MIFDPSGTGDAKHFDLDIEKLQEHSAFDFLVCTILWEERFAAVRLLHFVEFLESF